MSAVKSIFLALAVIMVVTIGIFYSTMGTTSTWERHWLPQKVLSGPDQFVIRLTTYRTQVPSRDKKNAYDNELKYVLVAEPGKKSFGANARQFLLSQATAFPHVYFRDRKNQLVAAVLPVDLQPVTEGSRIITFQATGTRPYPESLAKATDWIIEWVR